MSAGTVVAAVLLGTALLLVAVGCIALVVVPAALDRLHLATLGATPATLLVVAAVFVTEGVGQTALVVLFIGMTLLVSSAVVASATARAVLRERGGPGEQAVEGSGA